MTADPLKPCPFCGKDAVYETDGEYHGVRCDHEFCIAYYLPDAKEQGYFTKEYAYEAWNTRTPAPAPQEAMDGDIAKALSDLDWLSGLLNDSPLTPPKVCPEHTSEALFRIRTIILSKKPPAAMREGDLEVLKSEACEATGYQYSGTRKAVYATINYLHKRGLLRVGEG